MWRVKITGFTDVTEEQNQSEMIERQDITSGRKMKSFLGTI